MHTATIRNQFAADAVELDTIIHGDSIAELGKLPNDFAHLFLSDIPYGISVDEWDVLHNNTNSALLGSSPAQKAAGAVFKSRGKPINGWSEADKEIPREYQNWCASWAAQWFRIAKPGASVIIFAGRRFSHRCICAMEDAGFNLKDMLAWMRNKAPHRAQRISAIYDRRNDEVSKRNWEGWRVGNLRPTFEPILWFTKPYKIGTTIADNVIKHGVGGYNETAFLRYVSRPDNVISADFESNESGLHPTQKPVKLMQALIELVTSEGQIVIDPFAGSGSTLVGARNLNRRFIGFEEQSEFVEVCRNRLDTRLI